MAKFAILLCALSLVFVIVYSEDKTSKILDKIFKDYDPSVIPEGEADEKPEGEGEAPPGADDDNPLVITVNLHLRRIEVNDFEQEHTVQLNLRQNWTDKRLAYESEEDPKVPEFLIIDEKNPEHRIWKPDTFFPNDVEDVNDDTEHANSVIKILPQGLVVYSQRFTSTFSCPMTAEEYPFDEQTCIMDIASYGYTIDDVNYVWKKDNPVTLKVGMNKTLHGFEVTNVTTGKCQAQTLMGTYACLRLSLTFDREKTMETHKIFSYSVALVFASWIPFWLCPYDTAARAVIGVICLASTIMFNHLETDETITEEVNYVTPMHIWTDATLAFVFLALAQLAIVVLLSPRQKRFNSGVGGTVEQGESLINKPRTVEEPEKLFSVPFKEYHWGKRLDIICRILFPLAYLIFNIVFWSVYSD